MKRLHELTEEQQVVAKVYCRTQAYNLLKEGVVVMDKPFSETNVNEIGDAMAEDAWYSERNDQVIADVAG